MSEKIPAVYIMANRREGTMYVGVTSDLVMRVWQHKQDMVQGFTSRHQLHRLVYFELHGCMTDAIAREKELKKWRRDWKVTLVEQQNADWRDLWETIAHDLA